MTDRPVVFNHVGQCVTDLERSKRFYCELLGFEFEREINPPDELSATLMRLTPPLAMTASYLVRDGLVLELLHYGAPGQTVPISYDDKHIWVTREDGKQVRLTQTYSRDIFTNDRCRAAVKAKAQ